MNMERAVVGGGCFWCLEAVFERVKGVSKVVSGYAGSDWPKPDYREVCTGRTGHAEVIEVTFDPAVIPYETILDIFFAIHDPTTPNRQGADIGTQYRSIVLFADEAQQEQTTRKIEQLNQSGVFDHPIVTQVVPLTVFHPAEAYHQGYFRGHPEQGYCQFVISPKVTAFRKKFAEWWN